VALKFVSGDASEGAIRRTNLLREAQAAARLNHPNICTIYAAGEAEGRVFIAMEFLEGSDVKSMVKRGPLPWKQAASICQQTARGLEEAHSKNLFHRDIKSANIFVTRQGVVKLLDFGLASCNADPEATRTIAYIGTPNYMSPEQIDSGMGDYRSDIWSLGVVFYEMLTGVLPFGNQGKAVFRSILLEEPVPIATLVPDAPPTLGQIVATALRKNPEERYANIQDLLNDLEQAASGGDTRVWDASSISGRWRIRAPVLNEARTIAVLPLTNLSSEPNDEFLCDGLADELIHGLTGIAGLRVVSRGSSFQCRGTTLTPQELGTKLGATHLVNGSLRCSGERLRLTGELIETRTGYLLWSHRFDAEMKDLFALQDELSAAILAQLRGKLSAAPERAKTRPMDPAAYELYLRGRHFFNHHTGEGLREALQCFTSAQRLDPDQARNHIAIAECHASLEWYGLESAAEAVPAMKAALERGLDREPDSFASLCLLATVQAGYDRDWVAAEKTFKRALAASGGSADVWFHYGLDFLTPLGRLDEALEACLTASRLDPLSAITSTAVGGCHYRLHRWQAAVASLRTTLELHPRFGHAHWSLGRALLEQGEEEEALRQFDAALEILGPIPDGLAERGYALARVGRTEEAREVLADLEKMASRQFISPMHLALIFAGMGEINSAQAQLERAFEQGIRGLAWVNVDPRFHCLRGGPAFHHLLSRIGL
jgi:serine/threonine protein kinase/tetratricopeptide (TPR) repeat protein